MLIDSASVFACKSFQRRTRPLMLGGCKKIHTLFCSHFLSLLLIEAAAHVGCFNGEKAADMSSALTAAPAGGESKEAGCILT